MRRVATGIALTLGVVDFGNAIECTVSVDRERRVVRAVADGGGGAHFEED